MLEVRIEELTKAVRDLIEVVRSERAIGSVATQPQNTFKEDAEFPNVSSEKQKSEPTIDTSPPSSPEYDAVSYDDVKRITIAVSAKDKAKAVAALARFGVASAKALKEDKWGEYVAYMQKVASGEVDPEASE